MLPGKLIRESVMSEPVSSAEIEDVLSSIRRLVSENSGAIRRGNDPEETPDKLVLTPAFRVDEEDMGADQAPEPEVADGSADHHPADVTDDSHEDDAEGGDAANPDAALDADIDDSIARMAAGAPPSQDATVIQDEVFALEIAQVEAGENGQSELEHRIAELEAVIARSAAEFEPDGSEEEILPEDVVFRHRGDSAGPTGDREEGTAEASEDPDAETASETAPEPDDAEACSEPEIAPEPEPDVPPEVAPENADAGAATHEPDNEAAPEWVAPESDIPGQDWEDLADEAFGGEASVDAAEDGAAGADEAILDEDALRELVARMVREELQGSVGERITHNVRRMVRREIARALSLQSFE